MDSDRLRLENTLYYWATGKLSASQVHRLLRGYGYKTDLRKGSGPAIPVGLPTLVSSVSIAFG